MIGNIRFASRKEAKRYGDLRLMEIAGAISDLQVQPKYILQEDFIKNGKKYRKIEYIADFFYVTKPNLEMIVEDCKGYRNEIYKIKKKLFEYKYKEFSIREI